MSAQQTVINIRCTDIPKRNVDRIHTRVFGYGARIDPLTHQGPCLRKSDFNAVHDGVILQCPTAQIDERFVYQKVIENTDVDGNVRDIRVPVFGSVIPFCYLKLRPLARRFSNENSSVALCETGDLLSPEEVELLLRFCEAIGLDYGELDVLRDRVDGRIYIVDVNPTPDGPPNSLSAQNERIALERMARTFSATFLRTIRTP